MFNAQIHVAPSNIYSPAGCFRNTVGSFSPNLLARVHVETWLPANRAKHEHIRSKPALPLTHALPLTYAQRICCWHRNTVGSFSPIFLDRVYEEHVTSHKTQRAKGYPNQMDFGAFLDFMLAWDNRSSLAGIQYLFPVLDLKGRGYLTQVMHMICLSTHLSIHASFHPDFQKLG